MTTLALIAIGLVICVVLAFIAWVEWAERPRNSYDARRAETLDSFHLARAFGKPAAKGLSEESRRAHLQKIVKIGDRR